MPPTVEILAYEDTPLGPLCLRRRTTLSEPRQLVTEITLNHEFLMSSLHTDSEQALARLALEQLTGTDWRVLIGGLGLGYTAQAALAWPQVAEVEVVELLPQVVDWLDQGLIPLAESLTADARLRVSPGDIYQRLLAEAEGERFDAILIDVDHSPEDQLGAEAHPFYSVDGLGRAAGHLDTGGVLALWSYAESSPLLEAMVQQPALSQVTVRPIRAFNQHLGEEFTDWLYLAQRSP